MLIVFAGLQHAGIGGRVIAVLSVLLWGYVIAATYLAKLIPWYGGFTAAHARLALLWRWYVDHGAQRDAVLLTVCLGGLAAVQVLVVLSLLAVVALCACVIAGIARRSAHPGAG